MRRVWAVPHGTYRARDAPGTPDDPAHDVRATAHAGQARHWDPRDHAERRARAQRPPPNAPPVNPARPAHRARPASTAMTPSTAKPARTTRLARTSEHLSYVSKPVLSKPEQTPRIR
jgi:hypothetical protein